jgi:pilus assembly protein Flp/PilA
MVWLTTGGTNMMLQFDFVRAWLTARTRSERGAALVEYALLVALIAVVCIGAVTFLGNSAKAKFSSVGSRLG